MQASQALPNMGIIQALTTHLWVNTFICEKIINMHLQIASRIFLVINLTQWCWFLMVQLFNDVIKTLLFYN